MRVAFKAKQRTFSSAPFEVDKSKHSSLGMSDQDRGRFLQCSHRTQGDAYSMCTLC